MCCFVSVTSRASTLAGQLGTPDSHTLLFFCLTVLLCVCGRKLPCAVLLIVNLSRLFYMQRRVHFSVCCAVPC